MNSIRYSRSQQIVLNVVMIFLSLSCILPFILLITSSITDEATLVTYGYSFWPKKISLEAYNYIASAKNTIVRAYGMTVLVTVIGTFGNVMMTIFMGYLLSKKDVPGRTFLSFFLFFTMLFNGGMVPSYIVWTELFHIRDTIWALILPNLFLGAYNVILIRTYFTSSIPDGIIEAARVDSCSEVGILFKIVLPLSKPIIATITLFSGLAYWNDWINGLYYVARKPELYSIQNVLNVMVSNAQFLQTANNISNLQSLNIAVPTMGIRMAIAVIAVAPILIIYPFFQKYFVKGIVVGGIKG